MTNLIAISGRMGSGKDTTAKLIQNLIGYGAPHLQNFDDILNPNNVNILNNNSGWEIVKFAGALKRIASTLTGIPYYKFEDIDFKKTNLGPEWDNMPVRTFLQKLGTEAMRDGLHTNTWINAVFSTFDGNSQFLCTDCRFQNEFDAIKARDGIVIFVERGDSNTGSHPSEVEMDQFKKDCDFHIVNNGDLFELECNVKIILNRMNML